MVVVVVVVVVVIVLTGWILVVIVAIDGLKGAKDLFVRLLLVIATWHIATWNMATWTIFILVYEVWSYDASVPMQTRPAQFFLGPLVGIVGG